MDARGAVLRLEQGGHIAFDEYGDPDGMPVIFCHGWPSSRSMAQLTDAAARECGVRVISPDRPGINDSSFQAGRTLRDWPGTIRALAGHLSLGRFHVLAISGGAPYAFATAAALPEQVVALAVVSGVPPIAELRDDSGLRPLYRHLLMLQARQPKLLRMLFRIVRPFALLRPPLLLRPILARLLQPGDAAIFREQVAFESCFESGRRAWRGSAAGVIADAEVYAQPWGVAWEEIKAPVRLWHGRKDRLFAFRLAEQLAAGLPNCRLRLVDEAGHFSLPIRHMPAILRDLVAS